VKSAVECFEKAAKCEELAATAIDDATKALLLSTAANWRAMGQAEKARTQRAAQLAARYLSEPPATNK